MNQITPTRLSGSKFNWLRVDIFRFSFILFEVHSLHTSQMTGNFPDFLSNNQFFLKLNQVICYNKDYHIPQIIG